MAVANPIGYLQELVVKRGLGMPVYKISDITLPSTPSRFLCEATCGWLMASCTASSKKDAKANAALELLSQLGTDVGSPVAAIRRSPIPIMSGAAESEDEGKNPISALQEFAVSGGLNMPTYSYEDLTQPSSPSSFACKGSCGKVNVRIVTSSKKAAKTMVAAAILKQLKSGSSESKDNSGLAFVKYALKEEPEEAVDIEKIPNVISYLQEYTIKHDLPQPVYTINDVTQTSVSNQFLCHGVCGTISINMIASSKKTAKVLAAKYILNRLLARQRAIAYSSPCVKQEPEEETSSDNGVQEEDDIGVLGVKPENVEVAGQATKEEPSKNDNNIFKDGVIVVQDSISKLNQYCSKNYYPLPQYNPMGSKGGKFRVQCVWESTITSGYATSKKQAKQHAAEQMLQMIEGKQPYEMKLKSDDISTELVIQKYQKLSFEPSEKAANCDADEFRKVDEYSSEDIAENEDATKVSPVIAKKTEPPKDYKLELLRLEGELADLGVEYEITTISSHPWLLYFSQRKPRVSEFSSMQTGSDYRQVLCNLLQWELTRIQNPSQT